MTRATRHLATSVSLSAIAWAAMLSLAGAPVRQSIDPRGVVRSGSTITYLDLLRRLFPGAAFDTAKENVRAPRSVAIRNINDGQSPTTLEKGITVSYFSATWIRSDARPALLLTADVAAEDANEATPYEGETTILAAFDVDAGGRLIDALEARTDRFASLWDTQPVVHLSSDHDAVVVHNTHWNAGESYDNYTLLFLQAGKFTVISDITLFSTLGCGISYTETPAYTAVAHSGRALPDIALRVTVAKAADGAECDRRTAASTRTYSAAYAWDAKKRAYVADERGLAALEEFNRRRIGTASGLF